MTDKHVSPSIKEFSAFEEMTRIIEEQAREIDVLKINLASAKAALKARPVGVVLPERANENEGNSYSVMQAIARNQTIAEVARLNSPTISAGGVYSADPLACSGCVSGCFRCRVSAGVVDDRAALEPSLRSTLEGMGINPNTIGGKRLIDCCVEAVAKARAAQPDHSAQSDLINAIQEAVNSVTVPSTISPARAEYYKAGAAHVIRKVNEVIAATPTKKESGDE